MPQGYYWLIMTVFLLIMEVLTPGTFFMAALAVGTLAGGIVAFLAPGVSWAQWVAFCLVAPITVFVCRKLVSRLDKAPTTPMNVDALVGCGKQREPLRVVGVEAPVTTGPVRVLTDKADTTGYKDLHAPSPPSGLINYGAVPGERSA